MPKDFAAFLILAATVLGGCSLIGEPKVPAPAGLAVPEGTPITIDRYQAEVKAAEEKEQAAARAAAAKADREQKAEEAKTRLELAKLERRAKVVSEDSLASFAEKADELGAALQISAADRAASVEQAVADAKARVDAVHASFESARADVEARQTFIENAFGVATTVAQNTGVPGLGAIIGPIFGIFGMAFGAKKHGDAKAEKAASDAHDYAWEESKKELLAVLAMARGVSHPTESIKQ